MEKIITNLSDYGNTSAGSIPLALDEAVKSGKVKKGKEEFQKTLDGSQPGDWGIDQCETSSFRTTFDPVWFG